jgi:hypothetical protein
MGAQRKIGTRGYDVAGKAKQKKLHYERFATSTVGIIKQNRMLWAVFILQEEINE